MQCAVIDQQILIGVYAPIEKDRNEHRLNTITIISIGSNIIINTFVLNFIYKLWFFPNGRSFRIQNYHIWRWNGEHFALDDDHKMTNDSPWCRIWRVVRKGERVP